MPAIITNNMRVQSSDAFHNSLAEHPTYIYFGQTSEWENEPLPPDVFDSTNGKIAALDEVVGMKRVYTKDVESVIPRIDWIQNTVYDQYNHMANLIDDKNPDTDEFYKFYVVTDEFNVYKCLSNNNRAQSTIKPSGTITTPFTTPDGYKWKYMYTVRSTNAFRFMTPNWIPCYTIYTDDDSAQWDVQQAAVPGTIDAIDVNMPGSNYSSSNPPDVTITGDGSGCEAYAVIDDTTGGVEQIIVTNPGSGYKHANVTISGGSGANAEAVPLISPINGHGYDARVELGAIHKMFRIVLDKTEGGILPTDIKYRRTGMLVEPLSNDAGVELYLDDINGFKPGDTVTGSASGAEATVRSINRNKKCLYVENLINDQFVVNESVSNNKVSSSLTYIINTDNLPLSKFVLNSSQYKPYSGEIVSITSREAITRSINQIEELRIVVTY